MVNNMESTKLSGIYSNGMVLQRNKDIVIEGFENTKSEVTLTLAGQTVTAPVIEGKFKAVFAPMDVVFDTVLKVEVPAVFPPACKGFVFCSRLTEIFHFHLFKFTCAENEVLKDDFVSE